MDKVIILLSPQLVGRETLLVTLLNNLIDNAGESHARVPYSLPLIYDVAAGRGVIINIIIRLYATCNGIVSLYIYYYII